ncbi:MAG: hypothetical protein JWQ86_927 [Mycobacterium sp.]|nr:hypothetical protein [Mycobacterium sp.]
MTEVASAFVSLVPSAKNWSRQIDSQVGPDLDRSGRSGGKRFGGAMGKSAASGFRAVMGPALALIGTAAVTSFLKGSIDEAREAQKVGALTNNVIRTTGGVANITAKQVGALATAISLKSGMDDEAIQSGSNLLLTFKNVRNEAGKGAKIFDRATQAAVDLSAAGFGDLAGTSKQLGKALNDPIKGISALGRAGVTFTESQKEQIKGFVKSNDLLSAQKIILGEVESQVGGAAAAQATAGEKASVAWGNLKETIGTALLPVIDRLATFFADKAVPAISDFIGQMKDGTGAGGRVADAFSKVGSALSVVFEFIKNNKAEVATFVGTLYAIVGATAAWNAVLAINPISLVVLGIAALAAALVYAYKHSETFRNIIDGLWNNVLKPFGSWLADKMPGFIRVVGMAFLTNAQVIVGAFHFLFGVVTTVFGGILKSAAVAFGWVPGIGPKIKGASKAFDAMKDTVDVALDAVEAKISDTKDSLDSLGRKHPKPKVSTPGMADAIAAAGTLGTRLGNLDKTHARPTISLGFGSIFSDLANIGAGLDRAIAKAKRVRVGNNAQGTDNWRGGLTWVGEQGPELINLAKGAQVIPNHKIGQVSPAGRSATASAEPIDYDRLAEAMSHVILRPEVAIGKRQAADLVTVGMASKAKLGRGNG